MGSRFRILSRALRQNRGHSMERVTTPPTRRSLLFTVFVPTIVVLTIIISSIVGVARMPPLQRIFDPPQSFLPGNPFPEDASCPHRLCCAATPLTTWDGRYACLIDHDGIKFHVTYDDFSQRIIQTAVSGQDYTIGALISAWGTPIGFTRYGPGIDIYWETHYASLVTCSVQPDSPVALIVFSRERHWATPWRGFTSNQSRECCGP